MTKPTTTRHGLHGYNFYGCRCELCRAAKAAYQRKLYDRRRGPLTRLHTDARLRSLYGSGARYVVRERDGRWGIAGRTLDILLLRLRGSQWEPEQIHMIERGSTPLVSRGDVAAAVERLERAGRKVRPVKAEVPA